MATATSLLNANETGSTQTPPSLTPALVREVTEKVYALLLRDLAIERERLRTAQSVGNFRAKG